MCTLKTCGGQPTNLPTGAAVQSCTGVNIHGTCNVACDPALYYPVSANYLCDGTCWLGSLVCSNRNCSMPATAHALSNCSNVGYGEGCTTTCNEEGYYGFEAFTCGLAGNFDKQPMTCSGVCVFCNASLPAIMQCIAGCVHASLLITRAPVCSALRMSSALEIPHARSPYHAALDAS